jgi:predicted nucleic acid-binding protein
MNYLLDTNVVCEATAKQPDLKVLAWCERHAGECVLSCVTLGEIWKGIHLLPEGKRRTAFAVWAEGIERDFQNVTLALDAKTLKAWGNLYAKNEAKGFNMSVLDSLIAATALVHGLTIVTRNGRDFPPDVKTVNPWKS